MAFCLRCGTHVSEESKFCPKCGLATGENKREETDVHANTGAEIDHSVKYKETNHAKSVRKVDFEGEVRRCPNCGDIIDAYETVCESCGFEIRGRKTTSVVHELSLRLERTEDLQKKDELIRTFYIPNTKEDIYEFFILAISNIKVGGVNTDAWLVKLEQAYQKAELSFGGTTDYTRLTNLYNQTKSINARKTTAGFLKIILKCFASGYTWAILSFIAGVILMSIDDESMASMLLLAAGMLIAEFTFIGKDQKKKKVNGDTEE